MDINSLEPNSHKYRREKAMNGTQPPSEKPPVEKVTSGVVKVQRKGLFRRFVNTFFNGSMKDVKAYLIFDVLVPSIKETLNSMVNKGTEMILFGEATSSSKPKSYNGTYVSYGSVYREDNKRKQSSSRNRTFREYDDIVFEDRRDAEVALDKMLELIDMYGQATVDDLYDAAGIEPVWTEEASSYGWKDLKEARVTRIRGGYILDLPKCIRL